MKCPYCGAETKDSKCPKCYAALKKETKAKEPKKEKKDGD